MKMLRKYIDKKSSIVEVDVKFIMEGIEFSERELQKCRDLVIERIKKFTEDRDSISIDKEQEEWIKILNYIGRRIAIESRERIYKMLKEINEEKTAASLAKVLSSKEAK